MRREGACRTCGRLFLRTQGANLDCPRCYGRIRRQANKAFIESVKSENPCAVCGERDPIVLQFHHVNPESKWRSGGKSAGTPWEKTGVAGLCGCVVSILRIKRELVKCIVVCANCHLRIEAGVIDATRYPLLFSHRFLIPRR